MTPIVIGSRGSPLALRQAEWLRGRIAGQGRAARIEIISTTGDRVADRPLAAFGGKGVFVKEIEEALLRGAIDVAVHSLKDVPTVQPAGLVLTCVPPREDPRDILLAPGGPAPGDLPRDAVIGTGSPRRACQVRAWRSDLRVRDLRGNVDTRLSRLARGDFHGIILAAAGLRRLGRTFEGVVLDFDRMLPAVGQGALALETRTDDAALRRLLAAHHDEATAAAVSAERALLAGLGGGCQAPIAAVAEIAGATLRLRGLVAGPEGEALLRETREGAVGEAEAIGRRMADALLGRGAAEFVRAADTPLPDAP